MKQDTHETDLLIIVLQNHAHLRSIGQALTKRFQDRSFLAQKMRDRFSNDPGLVDIPKGNVDWGMIANVFMASRVENPGNG